MPKIDFKSALIGAAVLIVAVKFVAPRVPAVAAVTSKIV